MDSKELRSLMEAYQQINAPQEVEVDEAMSSYDRNRKRAAQRAAARNAARDAGKTGAVPGVGYVTPRRERETYVDSAGTTRHKSGARMEEVENKEEYLDETGKRDQGIRDRIKMFKKGNIEHTPPRNWDPDANRGKGATVSPKQAEKRRRKALRSEEFDAFDVILEFLIDEEIAQDIQEANWIMANAITEEQIDEILGMFKKKPEKKTEYAGRSMKKPAEGENKGYTVDKRRPEVSVTSYGKGGKTVKFKTRGRV